MEGCEAHAGYVREILDPDGFGVVVPKPPDRPADLRHAAVSKPELAAWKVSQAQTLAHFRGWAPITAVQLEYSLLERTAEGELIPMAQEMGMGVMPWSPWPGSGAAQALHRQLSERGGWTSLRRTWRRST
jgi:aryl-alcohol dehydrogenase-like predicted oxidoreductase